MHEWLTTGSRVKAIVGHFGSGKTEIALNAAVYLRKIRKNVRLIDLDIVNPFFRSAEQVEMLRENDIDTLYPEYALSAVDMPTLGPEILRAFEDDGYVTIFDVGGDDSGATALGGYYRQMAEVSAELYYVINPFRPRSSNIEQILSMFSMIELRARTKVTGIIANSNLGGYTTPETLGEGRKLISEVSKELNLPVVCECGLPGALFGAKWEPFEIFRYLKPEWMEL